MVSLVSVLATIATVASIALALIVHRLRIQLTVHVSKCDKLTHHIRVHEREEKKLQEQNKHLSFKTEQVRQDAEQKVRQANQDIERIKTKLQDQAEAFRAQIRGLKDNIKSHDEQDEINRTAIATMRDREIRLANTIQRLNNDAADKNNQLSDRAQELVELQARFKAADLDLASLKDSFQRQKQVAEDLQQQLDSKQSEPQAPSQNDELIKKHTKELSDQKDMYELKLQNVMSQFRDCLEQQRLLKGMVSDLQQQLRHVSISYEQLLHEKDADAMKFKRQHLETVSKLQLKIRQHENQGEQSPTNSTDDTQQDQNQSQPQPQQKVAKIHPLLDRANARAQKQHHLMIRDEHLFEGMSGGGVWANSSVNNAALVIDQHQIQF